MPRAKQLQCNTPCIYAVRTSARSRGCPCIANTYQCNVYHARARHVNCYEWHGARLYTAERIPLHRMSPHMVARESMPLCAHARKGIDMLVRGPTHVPAYVSAGISQRKTVAAGEGGRRGRQWQTAVLGPRAHSRGACTDVAARCGPQHAPRDPSLRRRAGGHAFEYGACVMQTGEGVV